MGNKVKKIAAVESAGTLAQARLPKWSRGLWTTEVQCYNAGRLVREEGKKWQAGLRIEEGYGADFTSTVASVATSGESGA